MPSNVENILNGILTGDGSGIQKPASRVEELLFEIYEQGGGGGGETVIGGIKLTIDENYVMTATLVDKDGEEYGVSDDIDLPLEEMVVDAEYDPQTQKIKLELKNGNYVEFSVAELVSGLQTELSSDNKLNPAYIAYDVSHRAVSDTEKNTWNAKQDTISDLEAIRSGAAAGATAVQPATMSEALAAKQNSLSETQLAAVNSGINSTKVGQISTNQANILHGINNGVKNICDYVNPLQLNNCEIVDGEFKQTVTDSKANLQFMASSVRSDGTTYALFTSVTITSNGEYSYEFNFPADAVAIRIGHNGTTRDAKFDISTDHFVVGTTYVISINVLNCVQSSGVYRFNKIMICTKQLWDTIGHDFQPPALPNSDLTRLEAEDRASLAEVVDSGAKNLINLDSCTIESSDNRLTFTRNGNIITASCTGIPDLQEISITNLSLPTNTALIISGCPSGGSGDTYMIDYFNNGGYVQGQTPDTGSGSGIVTFTTMTNSRIRIRIAPNTVFTNKEFKIMVCTKAAFGASQKFVPYQWVCWGNRMVVGTASGKFTENSSIMLYHNARLNKCIAVYDLNVASSITAGSVYALMQLVSGEDFAIPKGDVYEYFTADDDSYHIRIGKNSENRVGAFRVLSGTVPTGTSIKMQLEWTYI